VYAPVCNLATNDKCDVSTLMKHWNCTKWCSERSPNLWTYCCLLSHATVGLAWAHAPSSNKRKFDKIK